MKERKEVVAWRQAGRLSLTNSTNPINPTNATNSATPPPSNWSPLTRYQKVLKQSIFRHKGVGFFLSAVRWNSHLNAFIEEYNTERIILNKIPRRNNLLLLKSGIIVSSKWLFK